MQKTTQKLLTVFDLENLTGRKVSTWRKAIAQRKIPVVRIGRSVRVPYEAVQRLIEEGWRDAVHSIPGESDR
ncbi:MAG: helix-turn-helix domain-containing protein [Bdellovibrionales bacterium]|nr:helix-turn-helix domain-containing protein [Bdellovibrionales bacterium]